ncbi:threonine/serine ThrE exporter family protein [Streptomyces sp. Midd1]|uniref:threonine/serine ThrE exporter family protein n=1 Tax=Streptomyces sp. Midd3 TaxID=3161191 RepID=UPI0034DB756B
MTPPLRPPGDSDAGRAGSAPAADSILDLALRFGDLQLAAGQAAADVEEAMLTVLRAYGLPACEAQITFTMISLSHPSALDTTATTLIRTVRDRRPDYRRLIEAERAIVEISAGRLPFEQARERAETLETLPVPYPAWLTALAPGGLAASASLLVTGRSDSRAWITFGVAFVAAVAGERLAAFLDGLKLPSMYLSAAAAVPAAVAGVAMALSGAGLGGSAVVTGALFALFPGRALVGAVEDGLAGFTVTAAARLLEILYLVAGIILGVLAIIPLGVRLGAALPPEGGLTRHLDSPLEIPAAAALSTCLAIIVRTPPATLLYPALGGAAAWSAFYVSSRALDVNPITATGIGALGAALLAQVFAHHRHGPTLAYTTGALGPLLPGSLLYTGVLALGKGQAATGIVDLSRAAATALALALGVSLAEQAARLLRRANLAGTPK